MLYIFDRDGTLTITKSGRPCPNNLNDQELLPGVATKLKELKESGHFLGIASNQGGVGWGYMTEEGAFAISAETKGLLEPKDWIWGRVGENPFISAYKMSFYKADSQEVRRGVSLAPKPSPAMLLSIISSLRGEKGCEKENTVFVGNAFSDEEAARRAGVKYEWAHEFFKWPDGFVELTSHGYSPAMWLKKNKLFKEKQKNGK